MSGVIIGGRCAPQVHPRWRRALYRLGVHRNHRWLGDHDRAMRAVAMTSIERKHFADQLVIPPPVDKSGYTDAPGDMLANLAQWSTSFGQEKP